MNPKNTWLWLALAAGLFAFIFFFERHLKKPENDPPKVFPGLRAQEINNIQVQPKGQRAIHVLRTNGVWQLTEPLEYPAHTRRIEALLVALQHLTATPYLSAQDLKTIPDFETQFGFDTPQFSLLLNGKRYLVLIGRKTPPGDQVYLQVVGVEGVFVVDAELLKLIPQSPTDWRETALVDWAQLKFDRLVVTNVGKLLELQNNPTNDAWRMTLPMDTRADSGKVRAALKNLQSLDVQQFISDEPKADLDAFGLLPPELSVIFFQGTNSVLRLDFGKTPTNNTTLVYAHRPDQNAVVTVPKAAYESLTFSHSHDFRDFLDPHLVVFSGNVDQFEVRAQDNFTVEHRADNSWRVMPQDFPADTNLLTQVLTSLTNLQVTAAQIEKEIVPAAALPQYGLAPQPFRQYLLKNTRANPATNLVLAELDFGTNQNKLYARTPGESFVYSMDPAVLDLLPSASWQMRDRRVWYFTEADVASVTIQEGARVRQLLRKGEKNWTVAPGSAGAVDEITSVALDETIHRLGDLTATFWAQRGETNLEAFGFKEAAYRVSVELKNGEQHTVEFGRDAPSKFPYAAVKLAGETWVMEFPWTTFQLVQMYLAIPGHGP